jgi:hypothetical protein
VLPHNRGWASLNPGEKYTDELAAGATQSQQGSGCSRGLVAHVTAGAQDLPGGRIRSPAPSRPSRAVDRRVVLAPGYLAARRLSPSAVLAESLVRTRQRGAAAHPFAALRIGWSHAGAGKSAPTLSTKLRPMSVSPRLRLRSGLLDERVAVVRGGVFSRCMARHSLGVVSPRCRPVGRQADRHDAPTGQSRQSCSAAWIRSSTAP